MGDAWIIRMDEDGDARYLYELSSNGEVWVPYPEDAVALSRARAQAVVRRLGPRPGEGIRPVRRFEEIRASKGGASQ